MIAAGKVTRPKKTWEVMLKKIYDNESDLFYLSLDNKIISYLYCAKLYDFAWGWSQVNLKKYENISPRHFLEWSVMKYYKDNKINDEDTIICKLRFLKIKKPEFGDGSAQ